MAVEDINCSDHNENLSLPVQGDELEELLSSESQLCVPQDSLDDIDWFPSFADEIISLDGFSLTPEREISYKVSEDCSALKNRVGEESNDDNVIAFTRKKQRSKRGSGGKRGFWSMKQLEAIDSTKSDEDEEWNIYGNIKEKRKCTHCLSEKTPQWRMGPMGPKTLCNACGVRYKSGRLVAEYRPAASPTFDGRKHSNFHKKILRRKRII